MKGRNVALDALRFVAVTMVIVGHTAGHPSGGPGVISRLLGFFQRYGSLGVDLFFVLSGFLVSGLLFREYQARGSARVGRFLIRRGFKIYPAFYVFILITVTFRLWYGDTLTVPDIVSECLFVQNYGPHVWSHTWSLAVEEHFYLLLAGLVLILQTRPGNDPFRRIPLCFGVTTTLVALARVATWLWVPYSTETHRFPTHLEIDSLFFGVLLSYFFHSGPSFAAAIRRRLWLVYAGSGLALLASQSLPAGLTSYVLGHPLTYLGFGGFVVAAVCTPLTTGRLLLLKPIAKIGEQSYSIYLWHTAVSAFGVIAARKLLGHEPGFYASAAQYILLAYVVGIVMAKAIEMPALRLREWLVPDRVIGTVP